MQDRFTRVKVREQDPAQRAHNFDEVCFGYEQQEAMLEASRCLHCKKPFPSVLVCNIKIPEFIEQIKAEIRLKQQKSSSR